MDDDLFAVGRIDGSKRLCISSLARQTLEGAEVHNLGGKGGYYIYEVDDRATGGINVLAKAASLEAAFRLLEIWNLKAKETVAV